MDKLVTALPYRHTHAHRQNLAPWPKLSGLDLRFRQCSPKEQLREGSLSLLSAPGSYGRAHHAGTLQSECRETLSYLQCLSQDDEILFIY